MKIIFGAHGEVYGKVENNNDLELVMKIAGQRNSPVVAADRKAKKQIKKQIRYKRYLKSCSHCGVKVRGRMGMQTHTIRMHKGNNWSTKRKFKVESTVPTVPSTVSA